MTAWRGGAALGAAVILAACTGTGGGTLPPDLIFTGRASLGFTFTCTDGRLALQLDYTDHGTSPGAVPPFSVHGTADVIDQAVVDQICTDAAPGPGGGTLVILGQYRAPSGSPFATCPGACRFELVVTDNDADRRPTPGDYVAIRLSNATDVVPYLPGGSVIYARSGILDGGNITVD